jgi:hypothetical protein
MSLLMRLGELVYTPSSGTIPLELLLELLLPKKEGIVFHNSFGRWLYGQGGSGANHIIDEEGDEITGDTYMRYVCNWKGSDYANTTSSPIKFL